MRFFKSNPNASQTKLALTIRDLIAKFAMIWICVSKTGWRTVEDCALCVAE
jgi:hypothetical protein